MPTAIEYETVKQQVLSFKLLKCAGEMRVHRMTVNSPPSITIQHENTIYKFSDPDWNIISKQLNELFFTIKRKLKDESQKRNA